MKEKKKNSNIRFRDLSKKRGRVVTWPKAGKKKKRKEEEAQPVFSVLVWSVTSLGIDRLFINAYYDVKFHLLPRHIRADEL